MKNEALITYDVADLNLKNALVSKFPAWLELDYSSILETNFRSSDFGSAQSYVTEQLLGLMDALHRSNCLEGDYFDDGIRRIYWRARLTNEAWALLKLTPDSSIKELLSKVLESKRV